MKPLYSHTYGGYSNPIAYFLREYWILWAILLVVGLPLALIVYAELTREYYHAPVEACRRVATGRSETRTQCTVVGKNPCVPVTTVYHEYEYACAWRKME